VADAQSHSAAAGSMMKAKTAETTKKRKSFLNKKRKKKKRRKHAKQQQQQEKSKLVHGVKNENFELRNVGRRVEGSNYVITTIASAAIDSGSSSKASQSN
jgi:hypothetical protein